VGHSEHYLPLLGCAQDTALEETGALSSHVLYGVVSAQTEKVVEFFLEREAAEAMIGEVREDEPLLAEELRVEAIELH
jgi:hypothetical protein